MGLGSTVSIGYASYAAFYVRRNRATENPRFARHSLATPPCRAGTFREGRNTPEVWSSLRSHPPKTCTRLLTARSAITKSEKVVPSSRSHLPKKRTPAASAQSLDATFCTMALSPQSLDATFHTMAPGPQSATAESCTMALRGGSAGPRSWKQAEGGYPPLLLGHNRPQKVADGPPEWTGPPAFAAFGVWCENQVVAQSDMRVVRARAWVTEINSS